MTIYYDYVLVYPDPNFLIYDIAGQKFVLTDPFSYERRIPVFGEVAMVPLQINPFLDEWLELKGSKDPYENMRWKSLNEVVLGKPVQGSCLLKVGDRCLFSYQFLLHAEQHTIIKHEDRYCFLIRYDYIYGIETDSGLTMINNYYMGESVYRAGVKIPGVYKIIYGKDRIGELVFIGTRKSVRMEWHTHKKYGDGRESLVRFHEDDIMASVRTIPLEAYQKKNELLFIRRNWSARIEVNPNETVEDAVARLEKLTGEKYRHLEYNVYETAE